MKPRLVPLLVLVACTIDAPRGPADRGPDIPTRAELAAQGPVLSCTLDRWEDGDTPYVRCGDGPPEPVRLIGIDTAESGFDDNSRRRAGWQAKLWGLSYDEVVACGKAATRAAQTRCPAGSSVEVTGHERDKYDRRLGYLVCDGEELNTWLVQQGNAGVYPFPDPPWRPRACKVSHR